MSEVMTNFMGRAKSEDGVVNPWVIAVVVMLATFMEVLDTSVANVSLAAHRGQPFGERGREHLGTDFVSRRERDRAAAIRVAFFIIRTQKFLHVLRCALHRQFFSLRICAEPGLAGFLPRVAGRGRRSASAGVAGNSGGKFSARKTGTGNGVLRNGRGARSGHRANAGRMDHGQLQLALDFLHQHSSWHFFR